MNLANQKVSHVKFGEGTIVEIKEDVIWIRFSKQIGMREFLYPEAFENFLGAVDPTVSEFVLEALREKREQARLEFERAQRERQEELGASRRKFSKGRSGPAGKKSVPKPKKEEI